MGVILSVKFFTLPLEFLAENWLENNSSGKHEHMPKEDFENLISDELNKCHEKFKEYGVIRIEDLMDNIKGAYEKHGSKKLDLFFDELGMDPGKIEDSAKYYRHAPAHGKIISLKMARKFSLRVISYRLLLNRSVLNSLNFKGPYWDCPLFKFYVDVQDLSSYQLKFHINIFSKRNKTIQNLNQSN